MYETIQITTEGKGATLLLNRPDKLNAMNKQMFAELRQAFNELDERDDVKAIVIRGAGRAFCAGADLSWSEEMTAQERIENNRIGQRTFDIMERMQTPIFAAVHGYALGGGLEFALAADFIVAADNARLGLPEISLSADPPYRPKITEDGDPDQPEFGGAAPGWGGPKRLPERVGKALAKELMLTGIQVPADRALQIGLVNNVFLEEKFDEEVAELLARMSAMNHYNLRFIKELITHGYDFFEGHPG